MGQTVAAAGVIHIHILTDADRFGLGDENGNFTNDDYYKAAPNFYQHKPYNYYVQFLKEYRKPEYKALKKKYLPENL